MPSASFPFGTFFFFVIILQDFLEYSGCFLLLWAVFHISSPRCGSSRCFFVRRLITESSVGIKLALAILQLMFSILKISFKEHFFESAVHLEPTSRGLRGVGPRASSPADVPAHSLSSASLSWPAVTRHAFKPVCVCSGLWSPGSSAGTLH